MKFIRVRSVLGNIACKLAKYVLVTDHFTFSIRMVEWVVCEGADFICTSRKRFLWVKWSGNNRGIEVYLRRFRRGVMICLLNVSVDDVGVMR